MKFSDKYGYTEPRTVMQYESMDDDLRNSLWNTIYGFFFKEVATEYSNFGYDHRMYEHANLCLYIYVHYFKIREDHIPLSDGNIHFTHAIAFLRRKFSGMVWYEVYNFIEFLLAMKLLEPKRKFIQWGNAVLEREMAGYRIIDNIIVPVTDNNEIKEIEEALTFTDKYHTVSTHLSESLNLLSKNNTEDYRNSFKESISATECMLKIIMDDNKSTLGKLLKDFGKKYEIHPALAEAYKLLYGFTNDAGGIRHSLKEGDVIVDRDFAKFMLVSCSAFINYLKTLHL